MSYPILLGSKKPKPEDERAKKELEPLADRVMKERREAFERWCRDTDQLPTEEAWMDFQLIVAPKAGA